MQSLLILYLHPLFVSLLHFDCTFVYSLILSSLKAILREWVYFYSVFFFLSSPSSCWRYFKAHAVKPLWMLKRIHDDVASYRVEGVNFVSHSLSPPTPTPFRLCSVSYPFGMWRLTFTFSPKHHTIVKIKIDDYYSFDVFGINWFSAGGVKI